MQNQSPRNQGRAERLTARIDRATSDVNAFLLVLAVGLAVLDFTCFFAFKLENALPSPARVETNHSLLAKPAAAAGQQPMAAIAPTQPGGTNGSR